MLISHSNEEFIEDIHQYENKTRLEFFISAVADGHGYRELNDIMYSVIFLKVE